MAQWSRRRFLKTAAGATGAGLLGVRLPAWALGSGTPLNSGGFLSAGELITLNSALARMIPASGPGDWSAADVGVGSYIDNILSASLVGARTPPVFAGGPYRVASDEGPGFAEFQQLSRVKAIGWQAQIQQWQHLYRTGIAELDASAGGNFASVPSQVQEAILEELDTSGDAFFAVLYNHTMEGAYSHPVYGGNTAYRTWQAVGFPGDVHGVRFPSATYSRGAWNVYGGFAPEEIVTVGSPATEQPVTGATARRLP